MVTPAPNQRRRTRRSSRGVSANSSGERGSSAVGAKRAKVRDSTVKTSTLSSQAAAPKIRVPTRVAAKYTRMIAPRTAGFFA